MTSLSIRVHGTPAPQGSSRGFYNQKTGHVSIVKDSKSTMPWREAVKAAAITVCQDTAHERLTGPVSIELDFYFRRPKHHYRTGRNAHLLRDGAPLYVTTKPDLDKIVRSTFDALTDAGVWGDDNQVAELTTSKAYCEDGATPGVLVYIVPLEHTTQAVRVPDVVQGALL